MGLSDRDYARATPPNTPRRGAGIGRMRVLSVNTWVIIINVVVFVIGLALVRYDPQTRHIEPILWQVGAGTFYASEATKEQQKRAVVDRTRVLPLSEMPGYFGYPILDPQTAVPAPRSGRPNVTLQGQPIADQIGWERFTTSKPLDAIGHFSTGKAFLEGQVWRFITFQFLHASITHLVFNMLGLWFVGGLVEEYLGRRRYLAFYLISGLFGAVGYLTLNLLGFIVLQLSPASLAHVPAFLLVQDIYTPLIGASAGVFGVLMAAAYIAPGAMVDVMFVIPMKLRAAVYIFLGIALLNLVLGGHNAGGDAAHVGGAIAGAFFIRHTHLLRDFFDFLGDSRKARRLPEKQRTGVDQILAKITEHGLESLTAQERDILHRESNSSRDRAGS